jgi:hypothetical protein
MEVSNEIDFRFDARWGVVFGVAIDQKKERGIGEWEWSVWFVWVLPRRAEKGE